MIIETIVTTVAVDGSVNCAPMGVEWDPDSEPEAIVLKPFLETATYRNVSATRTAVVNLIDDVRVFARAAISNPNYDTVPAEVVRGVVLADACSWRELEVTSIDSTPPRSRIDTRTVHRGVRREFIGFNRARHAVLEAAIYATRVHMLDRDFLLSEVDRLQVIVNKTAGPRELEAMSLLADYIRGAASTVAASPVRGTNVQPTPAQQMFGDVDPKLAELTDDVLFGDVWERPGLSKRDRSLVTVSALIGMYRPEQLRAHLARARDNGVTQDELIETITHLAFYAGWPNAVTAISVAKEVFQKN